MSQRSDLAATGLTAAQVAERIAAGQVNDEGRQPTRTIGQIMLANIATRFNAILGGLFVVIAVVGPVQDGLFGLVLVANSGIGIAQELRAKRTLDRLTVLNAPTAAVLRGGMPERVPAAAVVLDDVVDLQPGDQVVVDGCCCWPGRHRHLPAPFGGGPSDADPADGGPTLPGQIEPVALVTQEEQLRPDGQATLAEGRRIIGNVDRVSRLFLTKTSYAVLIALAVAAAGVPYPFYPRHLTIISTLSIGIPAFFLALAPAADRVSPGFLGRALRFAVPAGIVIAAAVFGAFLVVRVSGHGLGAARTSATVVAVALSLFVLAALARPLASWRGMVLALAAAFAALFTLPWLRGQLAIVVLPGGLFALSLGIAAAGCGALLAAWPFAGRAGRTNSPES